VNVTDKKMLQAGAQLEFAKSPDRVFEAIVNPKEMSHFFISSGSDRMQTGKTVHWKFEKGAIDARVEQTKQPSLISFFWSASGTEAHVEMELVPVTKDRTLVKVSESGWPPTEQGIAKCLEQTRGWMHFLCCMKAYLEHNINLRKGGVVHG
jgi:uncharacterized protein YndB with AHSA1/START domain